MSNLFPIQALPKFAEFQGGLEESGVETFQVDICPGWDFNHANFWLRIALLKFAKAQLKS